jgi:hypothetical protein
MYLIGLILLGMVVGILVLWNLYLHCQCFKLDSNICDLTRLFILLQKRVKELEDEQ